MRNEVDHGYLASTSLRHNVNTLQYCQRLLNVCQPTNEMECAKKSLQKNLNLLNELWANVLTTDG
jgi:hypothetical protein